MATENMSLEDMGRILSKDMLVGLDEDLHAQYGIEDGNLVFTVTKADDSTAWGKITLTPGMARHVIEETGAC